MDWFGGMADVTPNSSTAERREATVKKERRRSSWLAAMGNGGSTVNSTAVGVIVGFALLAVLFSIGIIQFCCKYKCKNCKKSWKKCCKKKKPTLKEKIMSKVSTKKSSPPPFSISSSVK